MAFYAVFFLLDQMVSTVNLASIYGTAVLIIAKNDWS